VEFLQLLLETTSYVGEKPTRRDFAVVNPSVALSIGTHVDGRARYREQKDHYPNLRGVLAGLPVN